MAVSHSEQAVPRVVRKGRRRPGPLGKENTGGGGMGRRGSGGGWGG